MLAFARSLLSVVLATTLLLSSVRADLIPLPVGVYQQVGDFAGFLAIHPDGAEFAFLSPNGCIVGQYLEPIIYDDLASLLHLVLPNTIIRDLAVNVLELAELTADVAVLDAVVSVAHPTGLLHIIGTISLDLYTSVLPVLHLAGLHGLLDAKVNLVLPIQLQSLSLHDLVIPYVC
eukprot:TRINITY_DN8205_c0_g1_i1.p2 TRINITY_DN8205_c0_g1~~TRINITY_DN8205_c0_g1_i1.p2  ORF type:complete len:175 (+),score=55.20 TRINITY_DN8205_c0_g1_i1:448-972(+)